MKRNVLYIGFLILCTNLFAAEIKIYAPVAQNILIDKDTYTRYSPVNMFDNLPETVFAVSFNEINKNKPLLVIYFGEHAEFDTLSIKPGYFDERYFEKNDRIKKIRLKIFNCKNIEYNEIIEFQDKMAEQKIALGKKVIATKIEIYIQDIFPGSKWNDLVISDINFSLNGNAKKVSFDAGDCVHASTSRSFEYDDQDRLIHEYSQYGKAGSNDTYYKYEDGKTYEAYVGMDDDPNNLNYKLVDSVGSPLSANTELFYKDGKIIAKKYTSYYSFCISQYLYNNNQLEAIIMICENSDFMEKLTKYFYNEKGLLVKTISYEDATVYRNRYE